MKNNVNSKGQTIVEAIVVLGIVVLLVTGLIAGTTSSLRSVQSGKIKSQALKYAEEGMEYARNLRNQDWSVFQAKSGSYCLDSSLTLTPGSACALTADDIFTRGITFTWDLNNNNMTVVVAVGYIEGSQTKNVTLTTYFTNWR